MTLLDRIGGHLEVLIIAVLAVVVLLLYFMARRSSSRSRQRRQKILNRYRNSISGKDNE